MLRHRLDRLRGCEGPTDGLTPLPGRAIGRSGIRRAGATSNTCSDDSRHGRSITAEPAWAEMVGHV